MPDSQKNSNTDLGKSAVVGDLLKQVIDNMLEGFQIIDDDWRYLYVNETVAKQGKRSKEELLGKTMMECYPGIENTPLFKELQKCKTEQVSIRMENEFKYPDGTAGWFQLFIHPWEKGVLIFSADITDRKRAEEKLYEKINELNKVIDLTTDRELKMAQLKEIVAKLKKSRPVEQSVVEE